MLPTDTCHNLLIEVCTQAGRLDEALDLVKRLARQHGAMQQQTLNSLTRALSASHVDRALRLLSLMNTLGLRATRCSPASARATCRLCNLRQTLLLTHSVAQVGFTDGSYLHMSTCYDELDTNVYGATESQVRHPDVIADNQVEMRRETCVTLIRACAKASRSDVAEDMYWDLRRKKLEVTRSAGSALIVSLCAADAAARAQTVCDDMMMLAAGDKPSRVRSTAGSDPVSCCKSLSRMSSAPREWSALRK